MTTDERRLFDKLAKDRSESADMLDKPSMRGVKSSVVEKYSDQAHFIYELLQNADDVSASKVRFILRDKELLFIHNGIRHFQVTDPDTEEQDSETNSLGDLNAITSVANSNKTESSIGKFGVGFKAVFQYTDTPYIYDTTFKFKIDRFIVPVLIDGDHTERARNETLFLFPFNHKKRGKDIAFKEISEKLQSLVYPILFLNNLKELSFDIKTNSAPLRGRYRKTDIQSYDFNDVNVRFLSLIYEAGETNNYEYMWLFSQKLSVGNICIGYMADETGNLKPCNLPAFCFFPTKVDTGLHFIVHAPFLLTDSREGIKENEQHNEEMVEQLAKLAARSLGMLRKIGEMRDARLIDDSILKIVPLSATNITYGFEHRFKMSDIFYPEVRNALREGLLPTADGYTDTDHAFWADTLEISRLFSDEQLSMLNNTNGYWVFRSYSRSANDRAGDYESYYINHLVDYKYEDISKIANKITAEFIAKQSFDWLHRFYKWLNDVPARYNNYFKLKPIFINSDGQAQAAKEANGKPILFMPTEADMDCATVHKDLLGNPETREFLLHVVKLEEPNKKDYIHNVIVQQYKNGNIPENVADHFNLLFRYYCEASVADGEELIEDIKSCAFLKYYDSEQCEQFSAADGLYMPTTELREWFSILPNTRFVAYDEYADIVGSSNRKRLDAFLQEVGVRRLPAIIDLTISENEANNRKLIPRHTEYYGTTEKHIHGCVENIIHIIENKGVERSKLLWKILCELCNTNPNTLNDLKGRCDYLYYKRYYKSFDSKNKTLLKEAKWILSIDGIFVSANGLTTDRLNSCYDTESPQAQRILQFLDINPPADPDDNLTDEQREDIAFARMIKEYGIDSLEKAAEFKKWYDQQETKKPCGTEIDGAHSDSDNEDDTHTPDLHEENQDGLEDYTEPSPTLRDISRKKKEHSSYKSIKESDTDVDVSDADEDDFSPREVDYEKQIEREKNKVTREVEKIERLAELQKTATESKLYSYGWFKALLEMEAISNNESSSHSREINITFSRVEREKDSQRILVLKHPDRYIPHTLEEMADIPLHLQTDDQIKTVYIEVSSIKAYTLRVKLKNSTDIDGLNLDAVKSATIKAQSPTFLLEALMDKFGKFDFADDFDMHENLCENIEFIFGPPGTGKTTHLARNVLLPLMRDDKNAHVLVLTPTNKAADVIASRIIQEATDNDSYMDWLVRFGVTGDENIESSGVFRDRSFDFAQMHKSVVVTTIARFAYDQLRGGDKKLPLDYINWDYIVIDEASMIPLVNIIYPLYKKKPKKFYIAGDPFQIEPISAVSLWKDENIYKLVQLDSFVSPATIPHDYPVTLLKTQYRSVPSVGTVFSKLTYGGILEHYRDEGSAKDFNIDDGFFVLRSLNVIKFPVSRYESIYRSKKLQNSNYQIYSALFTFEFAVKLSKIIAKSYDGNASIGIIAPYRAQADLLDKLIASEHIPEKISLEAGTIHGFQGDECDIVIALFNTPPKISSSKELFLNKKNIINVSISRARDSLIMIMPDDDTENVNNLELIKRVERFFNEQRAAEYSSSDLEEWMFGSKTYLEDNSFATGHQNVNVYGLPEKTYEIRTEDTAVDIQIHRHKENDVEAVGSDRKQDAEPEFDDSMVISPKYGTGRIVRHRETQDGLFVDVMFDDGTVKSFRKEQAFRSGALKLRKR